MSILSFFNMSEPKTYDDDFIQTLEIEDGIEDEFFIKFGYYIWRKLDLTEDIFVTDFSYECSLQHNKSIEEEEVKEAIRNWFWKEFGATITFEV